jgi:hypothetical protein
MGAKVEAMLLLDFRCQVNPLEMNPLEMKDPGGRLPARR